ncbi:hypothetical protein GW17_00028214 [Ensete ventricosum]|nr:hypothetical protein GW17_00028214 [Ensete ventricosum]
MVILHGWSIDDIVSAFAYKPQPHRKFPFGNDDKSSPPPSSPSPPSKASSLARAGRGDGHNTSPRDFEPVAEGPKTPPLPQPPLLENKRRKKTPASLTSTSSSSASAPSSSSSLPSSFIRIIVAGKPLVVSRFFPLPPQASSLVVLGGKDPKIRKSKSSGKSIPSRSADNEKRTKKNKINSIDKNLDDEEEEERSRQHPEKSGRIGKQPVAQLSATEKKSDAYRRVPANSAWEPPASCHHLLQERHSFDPWRVLIICMLLNVTSGRQVEKVLPGLFLLCPDAEVTTKVPEEEIEKVIQTLGLQKKRARMIKHFSCEYLRNDWTHVTQLHGIGNETG